MREDLTEKDPVGRLMFSSSCPATPESFYAWFRQDSARTIEVGSWVVVESSQDPKIKYYCIVEELSVISDANEFDEFYSHRVGDPSFEPEIRPEILVKAKLRVLFNENGTLIVPTNRMKVFRVGPEEMKEMFSKIVKDPSRRIVGGMIKTLEPNGEEKYAPLYLDSSYLLGPEGAHINITGFSGLAAKTSYALFLVYSILNWATKIHQDKKMLILLFNVKSADFMYFHKEIDEDLLYDLLKERFGEEFVSKTTTMYRNLKEDEDLGLDLIKIHNTIARGSENIGLKYFTYQGDPTLTKVGLDERDERVEFVKYGLMDLTPDLIKAALYEEHESAYIQEAFWNSFYDAQVDLSFNTLLDKIRKTLNDSQSSNINITLVEKEEEKIDIPIHRSSAQSIMRRLSGFLSVSKRIIDPDTSSLIKNEDVQTKLISPAPDKIPKPIIVDRFVPGVNVIQLVGLSNSEQKIVVLDTIKKIYDEMGKPEFDRKFDFAIIVIDELNKYAPAQSSAPWKHVIIDIAARGRERNISLVGIEQFASKIDREVLGNCGTFVVGRQNTVELSTNTYNHLGHLKNVGHLLEKGSFILTHALYPAPIKAQFPIPPAKILSGR